MLTCTSASPIIFKIATAREHYPHIVATRKVVKYAILPSPGHRHRDTMHLLFGSACETPFEWKPFRCSNDEMQNTQQQACVVRRCRFDSKLHSEQFRVPKRRRSQHAHYYDKNKIIRVFSYSECLKKTDVRKIQPIFRTKRRSHRVIVVTRCAPNRLAYRAHGKSFRAWQ